MYPYEDDYPDYDSYPYPLDDDNVPVYPWDTAPCSVCGAFPGQPHGTVQP